LAEKSGLTTQPPTNTPDDDQQTPAFSVSDEEYPVDRLKSRVNESLAGRPLTVYLVLFAGAATLLLLLAVVWISTTGGGDSEEMICTEIQPNDARAAVLAGEIERVNILVDKDDPIQSLTGIQLRYADDTCRQTPQGAGVREELLGIIGAVDLYNNYSDTSIRKHYQSQDIESELLATSTATATAAPTETNTPPVPTATEAPPTATPSPTVSASPTRDTPATPTRPASITAPTSEGSQSAPVGNPGT
jgi:hypothetical protein